MILLTAQPDTIFERVGRDENRPVLNGRRSPEGIRELLEERRSYYEAAADITIETDKKNLSQIAVEIVQKLGQSRWLDTINPVIFIGNAKKFSDLMMTYRCAIREIRTKLEVLDDEFSSKYNRNPISFIKTRIKKPMSIYQKLLHLGYEFTEENIVGQLNDVAGVRVICPFIDDIYTVAHLLTQQDDLKVIRIKDYIKTPKPNGYRSYHMIVEIPVFFSKGKHLSGQKYKSAPSVWTSGQVWNTNCAIRKIWIKLKVMKLSATNCRNVPAISPKRIIICRRSKI